MITELEARPYQIYIVKPQDDGVKFLCRMSRDMLRNLLLVDTRLAPKERDKFLEDLTKHNVATTDQCVDPGFILIVIRKGGA